MRANEAPTVSSPLVPAATAILDRFLLHAELIITITARSYRSKIRQTVTDQACKKAEK